MAFSREIVDEVLTKTTPGCTQTLMKMRMAVATRMTPELFIGVENVTGDRSRGKLSGRPIHRDIPPHALYDFLEKAHTIHGVAHACLDFYIERSLGAKPECISDNDLQDFKSIQSVLYSERQSPGEPFQPKEFGPPTYLEEQIVIRALWQLQLFVDMKTAHSTGALSHWSEKDNKHLKTMADIPEIARLSCDPGCNMNLSCRMEQIMSVIEFIQEVTQDQRGPLEDVLSRCLHSPPLAVLNQAHRLPCCPKPYPISEEICGREVLIDIDTRIERRTIGCSFYQIMTKNARPPVKHVSFKPWRRLGFAIWQTERMVKLGFLGPKASGYGLINSEEPWFTWRSILSPEEDAERRPRHYLTISRKDGRFK